MLTTMTLDRPRGPHPRRKPIQDQRHHHRRLIRRPAMTIHPVGRIERPKIQAPDRVNHKPRQMIRRNPIPDIRRQQKPLLTTTLNEILRHPQIVQTAPDRTPFVKQPRLEATAHRLAVIVLTLVAVETAANRCGCRINPPKYIDRSTVGEVGRMSGQFRLAVPVNGRPTGQPAAAIPPPADPPRSRVVFPTATDRCSSAHLLAGLGSPR